MSAAITRDDEAFWATSEAGGRGIAPSWKAVIASMLALGLGPSCVLLMTFGPFAQAVGQQERWAREEVALGATIISLMIIVVSPIQGWLVDRYGARAVALTSIPLFGLGLAAVYLLPSSVPAFYGMFVILPILAFGVWPLTFMQIVASWFNRRLGLALGVTTAGIGIGAALLPVAMSIVLPNLGWRMGYALTGLVILAVVWPVAIAWLRARPLVAGGTRGRAGAVEGLAFGPAIRTKSFRLMFAAFFLMGIFSSGLLIHQVDILTEAGMTIQKAFLLQSVIGLSSIVGRLGSGWLLDRVPAPLFGLGLGFVAALAALIYASPYVLSLGVFAAIALGFVFGGEFDLLGYLIRRYHGRLTMGKLYGALFSIFQLGAAIGVLGMAKAHGSMGSYAPSLLVVAGLSIVAGLLFSRMGRYRYAADDVEPEAAVAEAATRAGAQPA